MKPAPHGSLGVWWVRSGRVGSTGFQNHAGRVGSGRVGSGRVGSEGFQNLTCRVGSGPSRGFKISRVGSGRVKTSPNYRGSGRVGSGRVGSGRVGSGRVGSGRVKTSRNSHGSGPVSRTRPDPRSVLHDDRGAHHFFSFKFPEFGSLIRPLI